MKQAFRRPPRRRQQPERLIHQALAHHLELRLPRDAFWWHPATGGKRSALTGSLMKSLGSKPGLPDMMVLMNTRLYGLELKAPGGRLSDVQKECHARLREAGAIIGVATGIDEALGLLNTWGVL
jgi:hypothetical protein